MSSWLQESFYRFQPVVTFTDELYVLAGGKTAENAVGWSVTLRILEGLRAGRW